MPVPVPVIPWGEGTAEVVEVESRDEQTPPSAGSPGRRDHRLCKGDGEVGGTLGTPGTCASPWNATWTGTLRERRARKESQ